MSIEQDNGEGREPDLHLGRPTHGRNKRDVTIPIVWVKTDKLTGVHRSLLVVWDWRLWERVGVVIVSLFGPRDAALKRHTVHLRFLIGVSVSTETHHTTLIEKASNYTRKYFFCSSPSTEEQNQTQQQSRSWQNKYTETLLVIRPLSISSPALSPFACL